MWQWFYVTMGCAFCVASLPQWIDGTEGPAEHLFDVCFAFALIALWPLGLIYDITSGLIRWWKRRG